MQSRINSLSGLGAAVKARREVLGLTQDRVASLSGLSRATVNALETGSANDLGIAKVLRIAENLGLRLQLDPATHGNPASGLTVAAKTASVSYKEVLPPEVLGKAIRSGILPPAYRAHIATLLDEAPIPIIVRAIEDAFPSPVPKAAWRRIANWACELQSSRAIWH
jgi:transcriptional regulator with XRE-family HTH domain